MTDWIALVPDGMSLTGHKFRADQMVESANCTTESEVLDRLGQCETLVRLGDGPPDRLPSRILPEGGTGFPALEQSNPPDIICATVRLWLAGVLSTRQNWDGVICATHADITHYIHISAGEAVSSQSFLTGRLVRSLDGGVTPDANAVADTLSRPERLAAHLRQAEIAGNQRAITGHLLGAELAATRPYWLGQDLLVIAQQLDTHIAAFEAQGVPLTPLRPEDLIEPGLAALGRALGFISD